MGYSTIRPLALNFVKPLNHPVQDNGLERSASTSFKARYDDVIAPVPIIVPQTETLGIFLSYINLSKNGCIFLDFENCVKYVLNNERIWYKNET